jgi:hypothetical protein
VALRFSGSSESARSLTAEHRVNTVPEARFFGQPDQQIKRFTRDGILRVVEKKPRSLSGQPLAALWVIGKELS